MANVAKCVEFALSVSKLAKTGSYLGSGTFDQDLMVGGLITDFDGLAELVVCVPITELGGNKR